MENGQDGKQENPNPDLESETAEEGLRRGGRIFAIDAMRGFVMLWLVALGRLVRELDQVFEASAPVAWFSGQMTHVAWEGLHLWDLVMPFFLFITGSSLVFSLEKRLRTQSVGKVYRHVLKRVGVLWLLGMVIQGNLLTWEWSRIHFFSNTLQAIAAGYLGASVIMLVRRVWIQVALVGGLILVYGVLLHVGPLPGDAVSSLSEPGRNFVAHVEAMVLGIHNDGSRYTWVLTSLVFTATVMMGCFAGRILAQPGFSPVKKSGRLAAMGGALVFAGGGLTWIDPCIKSVWSPSFTLLSGGWAVLVLAFFYLLTDVAGWKRWALPLVHIGSNALFIYVITEARFFVLHDFAHRWVGGLRPHVGAYYPLVLNSTAALVAWGLLYFLYRKRVFIKI